jgi:hypothetical protein
MTILMPALRWSLAEVKRDACFRHAAGSQCSNGSRRIGAKLRTQTDPRHELIWKFDAEHEVSRDLDAPGFVRSSAVLAILFFVAGVLAVNLGGEDVGWRQVAGHHLVLPQLAQGTWK